jgi:urea carboxylase
MTVQGATLRFDEPALFCLSGARMKATLDGEAVDYHEPLRAAAGSVLALGSIEGPGLRSYLCVRGGFEVPQYLGSRSTFT